MAGPPSRSSIPSLSGGPPSSRSSLPSFPGGASRSSLPSLSGEPPRRRLGVGRGGGGQRPVRAQIVIALVVALTLVAVPLYLMRRPAQTSRAEPDAGVEPAAQPLVTARPVAEADAGKPPERLKLAPAQRVRCGASARAGQEGSLCDRLAVFEEALAKAIRDSESCAPKVKQPGTINYVLTVDFASRALHVFPGASGEFKGPQARRATACVKRALPRPDWDAIPHQYRHYTLAILATYYPEGGLRAPGAGPTFQ